MEAGDRAVCLAHVLFARAAAGKQRGEHHHYHAHCIPR
jgi:hypothetical protein